MKNGLMSLIKVSLYFIYKIKRLRIIKFIIFYYLGDIDSSEEYYNILTEFLLLTKEGQAYIKDINFNKLPAGEYNITVLINVYLYNIYTYYYNLL